LGAVNSGLALCSRGTLGKGTLRTYPSWRVPTNDGYHVEKTNSNYNRAEEEFNTFKSFKRNKYRPK
jgi:hypothetical protein